MREIGGWTWDISRVRKSLGCRCGLFRREATSTLFKALCRYYYGIDPAAAAQHVHFYREWHEDQESEVTEP